MDKMPKSAVSGQTSMIYSLWTPPPPHPPAKPTHSPIVNDLKVNPLLFSVKR